ncbi:MAG: nitroreductase family protein [Methanocorpusculum sp.]|nr:nitroreductase family protein [Methanocorpusculum sp.]
MTTLAESIRIDYGICSTCGSCINVCPNNIILRDADNSPIVRPGPECISCGHCISVCPTGAMNIGTVEAPAVFAGADVLSTHLKSRRSIRLWKDTPVTKEECEDLIRITSYAPSGCNSRPVKWVVINDPAKVRAFVSACAEFLRTVPKEHPMYGLAAGLLKKLDAGNDIICRNAPAMLIAVTHPKANQGTEDSIIALTYADIYAPAIGLGTCWAGFVMILLGVCPSLGKTLGVPDGFKPQYALLAGHPKYQFKNIPPRTMPEIFWT